MMKASIVIPVWNGREYIPACLDALLAQDYSDFEVIVVDNASADGSSDLVAEKYPQVQLIRNTQNLGFAGGCNVGLRAAQGDVLVLLNQDTVVLPGWLRALVEALQRPEVGVVGCKILYPDGKTIQHAGGWIEWPLGLAHHYGQGEQDNGQWDEPRRVEYVTGAAMVFRRDVLERVGPLDEGFWPAYFEDADFCFRAREAGFEVWYIPGAVVLHKETVALTDPAQRSSAYQRGRLRFVLKHLPPDRFFSEFMSAEKDYQRPAISGYESGALQGAYLEAMATGGLLLRRRWGADREMIQEVLLALGELYRQAWLEDMRKELASPGLLPASTTFQTQLLDFPSLEEYQFRSAVPILGPLIARFRSLWYSVAARWAIRDLIRQQEAINRQQAAINRWQEAYICYLAEMTITLARRIADLSLQIDSLKGNSDGGASF